MEGEKAELPEIDTKKLLIAAVIVLVVTSTLFCCLWNGVFLWVNNSVGGLGNPYLFWP
ncbi:MAG: hypothetical protein ACE5DX_01180 [Candidatus Dojkabacteria bacterium]